jgi:hypothetical protein
MYPIKWTRSEKTKPRIVDTICGMVYNKPRIVDTTRKWITARVPKWGVITMAAPHNKLTKEQIEYFKSNPHIRHVGQSFVYFKDDFKEQFWRMYHDENLLPQEILLRLGVDYEMLGRKRVEGIVQNLKIKYADGIAEDKRKKRKIESDDKRQMSKLRAEVEYLRQENEFLKKIVSVGKEVRR